VTKGATVTWTNTDSAPHTVTADGGAFSSATLADGSTFSHRFTTTGTFAYHCAIHPSMTGTVIVSD
jgi:plastocyanin